MGGWGMGAQAAAGGGEELSSNWQKSDKIPPGRQGSVG